ncbi:Hypothetical predicted protein [Olea europaea subsp. europaea]|uniref:Uncharacterized protein n=1 Tax=Olea europaea subsp. europaea TaxID=158383 RepID=A0A8S0REN6_OLEEU|nr:Hypothetical predicted protein [Olea europaea subsp. europaea]
MLLNVFVLLLDSTVIRRVNLGQGITPRQNGVDTEKLTDRHEDTYNRNVRDEGETPGGLLDMGRTTAVETEEGEGLHPGKVHSFSLVRLLIPLLWAGKKQTWGKRELKLDNRFILLQEQFRLQIISPKWLIQQALEGEK